MSQLQLPFAKRLRSLTGAVAGLVLLASSLALGQDTPPVNPPAPPKKDTGTAAREALRGSGGGQEQTPLRIDPIDTKSVTPGTLVTFRAVVRDNSLEKKAYKFSLEKAPASAAIEANTGVFSWTPDNPGIYTFNVIAVDEMAPDRIAVRTVTISVVSAIEPYGYRFFEKARAAVQAKLQLIRSGAAPAAPISQPVAAQPAGDTVSPPLPAAGQGANPATGQPTPTSGQPTNPPATQGGTTSVSALNQIVSPLEMIGGNIYVPSPERYQLGPGDLLTLRYWSPTMEVSEQDLRVDQFGGVNLPTGGRRVVLRGKSLAQAEAMLKRELQLLLKDADLTLSLKELRTMSVTVTGEAYLPGNYQMPAVATLFNGLYAFGGPNENGSLRRIELHRTDGTVRSFDFYRFLIFGDASQDVPLQPGDVIYIQPAEKRVTVKGEVMRPAIYELLPNERMRDAIRFAGGARASGVTQRISLETVEPGVGRKLVDVDLTSVKAEDNPQLYDGDTIEVMSVRPALTNLVEVEGAVDQPGQYALLQNMTVADLLERARGPLREAYFARADLFRTNPDHTTALIPIDLSKALARDPENNPVLQLQDRLVIYRRDDVQWMGDRQVRVRGAVQAPGSFYRADNMRVADVILQARGIDGSASEQAFLQRVNPNGTMGDLITIDLMKAVAGDPAHNLLLQDRDILTIQTERQAKYIPEESVRILGAVQAPDTYPRAANLTLGDLLRLAGGPMPNAGETIEVAHSRVSANTPPDRYKLSDVISGGSSASVLIQSGDLVTVSERRDFQMAPRTVMLMGEVANPGPYALQSSDERLSSIIQRAGGLTARSFPEGVQFLRDPKRFKLPVQDDLSPRLLDVLKIVADDEYKRALARAEVERAQFVAASQSATPALSIPGVGQAEAPKPVELPQIKGDAVTPARQLRGTELDPAGNLSVDVQGALARKGGEDDLILEEGDIIIVPPKPTTVTVAGAVTVPGALLFDGGKNVGYYIDRTGGPTVDAALDRVLLIRARGSVVKANKFTKVELGDIIFVPTKVMAVKFTNQETQIDSISKRITAAGFLFAIIRTLIK